MKYRLFFTACLALCLKATAADGGSDPDTIRVRYHFKPVVVTATKISQSQTEIASSISVLDETEIRDAAGSSALELIQSRVPGFYLTEWGVMGFGAAGSASGKISMRGIGGGANTHCLILRNGRPDFMGFMGCTLPDEFSTDGVERIEIIRGPGSFLYGTNATGGIINIIPKRVDSRGFETRMTLGTGSYDSRILSASHGGNTGSFDYYLSAATRMTDGHRSDGNARYLGDHYTVHLGWTGEKTKIEWNANAADIDMNDPGMAGAPSVTNWYAITRGGTDLNFSHQSVFGETNLKLHGNFGHHQFFDGWKSDDRTLGFMIYQTASPWTGSSAVIGLDFKKYGGKASDAGSDYGSITIREYGPYVHIQQWLFRRLVLSGGVRVENHQLFGNETLPKAGLVYHPFEKTGFRMTASKGFRSPSIRELYLWMPANKSLTPDRVWNYEIGVTQNIRGRLNFDCAVFRSDGSNLIQFTGPPPKWMNGGSYSQTGYEMTAEWFPLERLQVNAAWTKMDLDRQTYNAPGKKLTFHARYALGIATFSAQVLMIRDWKGAEFQGSKTILHDMPDYAVWNASVLLRILRGASLRLHIRNILDESYQAMYGYPMPGRNMLTEISYAF
ncbi:TonB-dependent receptor [bacterium]|nr:TonB-dependent receptor [bacterium]